MGRIAWLELQMDRDDLTDEEFKTFNTELNDYYSINEKRRLAIKVKHELQLVKEIEEIELAKVEAITEEEVERMYIDSCTKYQDVNGESFELWYKKSLQYYSIDSKHTVHAIARSSKTVELIHHVSQAHAKLTILTRIKYKFYDHAVRGYSFAWDKDEK